MDLAHVYTWITRLTELFRTPGGGAFAPARSTRRSLHERYHLSAATRPALHPSSPGARRERRDRSSPKRCVEVIDADELQAGDVARARSRLEDTTRASVPILTAETGTIVPYSVPWARADAFDAEARSSVVYRAPFAMEETVPLFASAGIPDAAPAALRASALEHVSALTRAFRVGVASSGNLGELPCAPAP